MAVVDVVAGRISDKPPADLREVDGEVVQTTLRARTPGRPGRVRRPAPPRTTRLRGPDHQHRATVAAAAAGQHAAAAAPHGHPHAAAPAPQVRQHGGAVDVDAHPAARASSHGHRRQDPTAGPVATAAAVSAVRRPRDQPHRYRLVARTDQRLREVTTDDVAGFVEPQMRRRHVDVRSDAGQRELVAVLAGALRALAHCEQSQSYQSRLTLVHSTQTGPN